MTPLLVMTVILGSGCATGKGSFCQIAKPIYVSAADVFTEATADQILEHNEVWRGLCLD